MRDYTALNELHHLLALQRALFESESSADQCATAFDRRRCQRARGEFEDAKEAFEQKLEGMR